MEKGKVIDFSYMLAGDLSPNGLQKVFFSFHPGDIELMKQIAGDVLDLADCAVCYHTDQLDENAIDLDDFSLKLGEMKLFVVIVTSNYLINDSLSKNFEYGFAVRHNIPILPVAAEPGLEEYFAVEMNRIGPGYGDIQLLKSQVNDKTEISYQEKLLRDLSAFLVDDKVIKRIEKAFCGRIFLSYRKKDRKYANELMRVIHGIPSLQRVSIWYDEFISTGENWSDQIEHALKDSDVFLLMVTPSITEPDNYVIREEYPNAQAQEKTIVSAKKGFESPDAFDPEILRVFFPGLKTFVDGDDAMELEKALQTLGNKEASFPEEDYLIGLAFFNGVGMEKDNEKAVSLIVAAAQEDFPEAVDKLAQMYWSGDGIAVNYENSILWKKRLVHLYQSRFADDQEPQAMWDYVRALEDLTFRLYELSAFRESLKYGKDLVGLLDGVSDCSEPELLYLYRIQAYDLCGKNCKRLGRYDEAFTYAQKDCELSLLQYQNEPSVLYYDNLSVAYQRLGDICYETGDLKQAESWYQQALKIDEQLYEEEGSSQSAYNFSASLLMLGDIYIRFGNYAEADRLHERAVVLRKKILDVDDSDRRRREYGEILLSRGSSQLLSGNTGQAKTLFEEAIKIYDELVKKNGMIESIHAYSVALNRYAKTCEVEGDDRKALKYYTESLEHRKKILSHIRTEDDVFGYALTRYFIAGVHSRLNDDASAKTEYEESIDLLLPILNHDRKGDRHRIQAEASFARFQMDTFSGERYLRYSIDAWRWLTEHEPENQKYRKEYEMCQKMYRRCYPV